MNIKVKHRLTDKILFEAQAANLQEAITTANEKITSAWRYSDEGQFLEASYQTLDLQGADLAGADLREANLSFIGLSNADLRGADLRGAKLWLTNLSSTELSGADLRNADLSGALWCLRGLPTTNAMLTGANFAGCKLGMSWSSRLVLTELLRQAAGEDTQKQQAGEQIPIVNSALYGDRIAWSTWAGLDYPLKAWSLDVLSAYVDESDDTLPRMLRNRS